MTPATQLIETLGGLRRQWRQRVLLEAVVWIAIAMLMSILAGQLITSGFGSAATTGMFMRGGGYLVGRGCVVVWAGLLVRAAPLVRRLVVGGEAAAPVGFLQGTVLRSPFQALQRAAVRQVEQLLVRHGRLSSRVNDLRACR